MKRSLCMCKKNENRQHLWSHSLRVKSWDKLLMYDCIICAVGAMHHGIEPRHYGIHEMNSWKQQFVVQTIRISFTCSNQINSRQNTFSIYYISLITYEPHPFVSPGRNRQFSIVNRKEKVQKRFPPLQWLCGRRSEEDPLNDEMVRFNCNCSYLIGYIACQSKVICLGWSRGEMIHIISSPWI